MVLNLKFTGLLTTAVETQSKEVLMVVLPIVGIVVVLLSLALLAVILKQFIFIDGWKKLFEKKEAESPLKKAEPVIENTTPSAEDEDEMAAIATALFLYQTSFERIALTEIPLENSPWTAMSRSRQTGVFTKWQSRKTR
jgi:hypothetical protein